jgi:hypothetical protein
VPPGDSELGAIQLRLPGVDSHPVFQVGQVCRGGFSRGDGVAQSVKKCPLQGWSAAGVLGEQECCLGSVLAG